MTSRPARSSGESAAIGSGSVGVLITKNFVASGDPAVTTKDGQRGASLRAYDKQTGAQLGGVRGDRERQRGRADHQELRRVRRSRRHDEGRSAWRIAARV